MLCQTASQHRDRMEAFAASWRLPAGHEGRLHSCETISQSTILSERDSTDS